MDMLWNWVDWSARAKLMHNNLPTNWYIPREIVVCIPGNAYE
jgi:hypothetical protein